MIVTWIVTRSWRELELNVHDAIIIPPSLWGISAGKKIGKCDIESVLMGRVLADF